MSKVGNNTIILNVAMTGQSVCVLFRDKNGHVVSQHVILPPKSETGYHEATADYTITALSEVNLERLDRDGQHIDNLVMKPQSTLDRKKEDARHNVCNRTNDFVIMMK